MRLKQSRAVFTTSRRAVSREPDLSVEDIISKNMDAEIFALVQVANDQDWRVDVTNDDRLAFYPADKSKAPIFISKRVANGRGIKNVRAGLARAGLNLDHADKFAEVLREADTTAAEHPVALATFQELIGTGDDYDASIAKYVRASLAAALDLEADIKDKLVADAQGSILKMLQEAEQIATDAMGRAEKSEAEARKFEAVARKAERERDDLKTQNADLLERARLAENNLSTIRTALGVK